MRAVILAGGKGMRLQPYTASFPKPLMPLGDTPVLEVLIRRLVRCGIRDITLSVGHLSELVKAYFNHRHSLTREINLRFVVEEEPLGTAGSLALVPDLTETFLAMNGDLLTDIDFKQLLHFHRLHAATLTIATHTREVKVDLGVVEFDEQFRLTGYREKPRKTFHVSMGIYAYEPRALRYIEPNIHLDFPELVLRLLDAGERVCAYLNDSLWLDIGNPEDYARAQELFATRREAFES